MFDFETTGDVSSDADPRPSSIGMMRISPPTPSTPATGPEKGGKGGSEALPPLPPSNAEFLAAVIGDVPEGAAAAVCSIAGDPALNPGGWPAQAAGDVDRQCPDDHNNYLNCSTFLRDNDGSVQAKKDRLDTFRLLMLDDVGTKVDRAKLKGFRPTWEIETSPGNSQIGIRLAQPIRDTATVKWLQDAVIAAGLSDAGAKGVARWVRLPNAVNGKARYRVDGESFSCRLITWNPDVAYTVAELVEALGLTLDAPTPQRPAASPRQLGKPDGAPQPSEVFTPAPSANPVIAALTERGLYKHLIERGKHDVTCPWVSEHTDAVDGGTAYFDPTSEGPQGGFSCLHSHGDRYRIGELLTYLDVTPEQARGKARIDLVPGEMNRIRSAAERTLALQGGYYQAGGAIVTIRTNPSTGDVTTELLSEPALASALAESADWFRYDARGKQIVRTDPPSRIVQALLRAEKFDHLPALSGLTRQPFFRDGGGGLVLQPGYDPSSGRFAAFDPGEFVLPEPTREAAEEALDLLKGLLPEFRFATDADRSAALCAMLTAAVRPALPTAPAFNITASTPGSGKSYLADTITPFAGPGTPLKTSYPTSADEATKVILSTFLGSPAVIVFDDMQTDWQPWSAVNRALTSDTITDRVLGVSRMLTVGTRSLVMGTGNNVGPVRDMTRRVVTIKLHHKVATPALIRYEGQPALLVARERGRYVSAALTIIAAWRAAGSPRTDVPSIASFGEWSDMCRQPLLWLGETDPAASIIDQLAHDPAQDALGELLRAWFAAIGDRTVMLRQVLDTAADNPDLDEALQDLPVTERGHVNRSKLGWFLKRNADRVVNGFELQAVVCSTRNAWRVVKVEPEPATA